MEKAPNVACGVTMLCDHAIHVERVHVNMELLMRTVGVHQSGCAGLFRCADTWRIG